MTPDKITAIILGLLAAVLTFAVFVVASRANRQQAKAATVAVDAAAYQRAKEIYEGALSAQHEEVQSMRHEVAALRREIAELRRSNDSLQRRVAEFERAEVTREPPSPATPGR